MLVQAPTMNDSDAWDESRMGEPTLLKYNVHTPLQEMPVKEVKKLSEGLALPLCLMTVSYTHLTLPTKA